MSEVHAAAPPDRGRLSDSLATAAEHLRRITARVETRGRGIGSATIWRPDGWIATNAHVAHHPVSVVLVYFSVFAPSATPASKVSAPALVVRPKSATVFVPPLSLTTRLTIVSEAA